MYIRCDLLAVPHFRSGKLVQRVRERDVAERVVVGQRVHLRLLQMPGRVSVKLHFRPKDNDEVRQRHDRRLQLPGEEADGNLGNAHLSSLDLFRERLGDAAQRVSPVLLGEQVDGEAGRFAVRVLPRQRLLPVEPDRDPMPLMGRKLSNSQAGEDSQ